jgi:uncharacterized membrane protein YeaQ/YmgE (transglycosylase-associated protein family)
MDLLWWIVIGFIAGSISGWFVGTRSVQGCLPTIVVGVLGAIVGGWVMRQAGNGPTESLIGSIAVAILGSIIVRIVLRAVEGSNR